MLKKVSIIWFRRDLRIDGNDALQWACENSERVIPVFIHSPEEEVPWSPGAASRWWLHHSLIEMKKKLDTLGLPLQVFSGRSQDVLTNIILATGADSLVFNRLHEPDLFYRDRAIEKAIGNTVEIKSFDSGLFFSPGTVLNNQHLPYRVFTPFYKKIRPLLTEVYAKHFHFSVTRKLTEKNKFTLTSSQSIDSLNLLDEHSWHENLALHWKPGEDSGHDLLDMFVSGAVDDYEFGRDIPSIEVTSKLSPYLHFGEITPQQILSRIFPLLEGERDSKTMQSAEVFLKQLVWREFAHNVLWHFPETATQPMDGRYTKEFWRGRKTDYIAWTKGETGIPIIDAGMKQLWQTGWMHNRVRMITSSFLTKNLGVNWLHGARWFWDTLVDANLANNSLGWQWVAGCGVDAAPYYRVFNPTRQTERFDNKFKYIDIWLPEHVQLDYPSPIVDVAVSRKNALDRYKQSISI